MKKTKSKISTNTITKTNGTTTTKKKRTYKKKEKYPEHLPSLWGRYGYMGMTLL